MSQRRYSIDELNQMRKAILRMLPLEAGTDGPTLTLVVESRLQSHILAGTDPEELIAKAKAMGGWEAFTD